MPISERPTRISFVAHSLGGLIVRALCSLPDSDPLLPKFHTLMTLNSPHLGLLYNQKAANWGVNLFQV
jgi:alpha-beta hydrolase superfamily lysophospholipase